MPGAVMLRTFSPDVMIYERFVPEAGAQGSQDDQEAPNPASPVCFIDFRTGIVYV